MSLLSPQQSDAGWEEYYDYIFPEDAANQPNLKLLAMARMWKRQQAESEDVAADQPTEPQTQLSSSPPSPSSAQEAEDAPDKQLQTESGRESQTDTDHQEELKEELKEEHDDQEEEGKNNNNREEEHDDRDDSSSSSSSSESEEEEEDGAKKKEENNTGED